jgi:transcription termination factor Rho
MDALKVRQKTANSPEKELLAQIYAILHQRSTGMDDLPRLHELRPPMRLRRAIELKRAREMEEAMETANEKSIVRLISTVIPMKAGRGWFSVSDNKIGPTQHLQSISHSISLPKRALTDPVGYAISGLIYRIAKRDDE